MKRIILPLILCAIFATYLYADLNPYAYGLSSSLSQDETTLTVNYSLNAAATGVSVVIMDGAEEVKTVTCDGKISKGSHSVEISTLDLPTGKSLTWKVVVTGNSVASPTLHDESIRFYLPYGLDCDVDPESDYLGNWYVIEATNGGQSKSGYQSNPFGRGLYAFDAALNPILNSAGTRGFTGGINVGATETNVNSDYINFYRVATSGGRVFIGRFRDGESYHPIVEANPKNLNETFTSVVTSGRAVSIDARGSGENLKLVMLGTDYSITEYDLGTAKSIAAPSRTFNKNNLSIVRNDATIAYDNEGGIWLNKHRASATATCPTIAHISASNGFNYNNISDGIAHNNTNNGGIAVSPDGKKLAVVGAGSKKLTTYDISKVDGQIKLTQAHVITVSDGDNHTALAWDYAGNLYAANRSSERIRIFAMPYSGSVSTPCASKYAFELEPELNIYASGLKINGISPENRKASISYFLNAPATAVEFQLLDANKNIVHTVDLNNPGHLTKGQHDNVELDLFDIPNGNYTWAIKATAGNHAHSLTHINKSAIYKDKYYSVRGLSVDNSTESLYLGRIYIAESYEGKTTTEFTYNRTTHQGIYILDPTLTDVRNGSGTSNDPAYDGGIEWTEGYGPYRTTLDKDGFLYICDNGSQTTGVWRMDPAHPDDAFTPVLATSGRGTNYNLINSIAIDEENGKKILYLIDNNGKVAANSKSYLKQYDITNLPNDTKGETLADLCDTVVAQHNTLVRGIHNDLWVFQNRGNTRDVYPAILHYRNEDGTYIKDIDAASNGDQWWMVPETAPNTRGSGAISPDGSLLAFHGNGRIIIYSIGYDSKGTPTTVDKIEDITVNYGNVDAMAFDIANNLYLISSTKERFYAYAFVKPGAANSCTTPAPSSQSITLAEPVPHIMAYNLNVKQNGKYYDFSFYANSNATSGKLLFYDNTDEYIGEINIEQAITKGNNTISLLTHELPEGNDMVWKLQLSGADNEAFGIVYESPTILQRAHAAIDNSPESDYFGRIYISNNGKDKGCYIYDYKYSDIRIKDMCGMTDITTSGRPAVDAEGYVYWADYGDNHGGIYVMNPKTFETHPFFDGEKDATGLWTNGEVELGSSCSGASIYGSGANTILFATSEDSGGEIVNDYAIYNIGQNDGSIRRTWNETPTQRVELNDNMNANGNFTIVGTSRGAWLCQNRSNGTNGEGVGGARSLIFCGKDGRTYYRSTEGYITGSQGAGMAVSADESKLAMVTGTGDIFLFDLNWTYDNTAGCELPDLILSKTYRTKFSYISSMHFDYAGNLVTMAGTKYGTKNAGSDDMRLVVFSTPTDNNTTTIPARTRLTVSNKITLLDTEDNTDLLNEHKGQIQNASVFRSLTAGMYNTLCLPFNVDNLTGTPLEDATVWQYNGATVENEATNKEIFLNFEEVTAIEAGKPYLVEPATNIAAPMEFKNVTISVTNGSEIAAHTAVTMYGILHPTELQANDKSILFLIDNNNLAWANVTANINGMRAYFKVNEPSLLSARTRAYIRKEPTVATDMENITTSETEIKKVIYNGNIYIIRGEEVYTIQGTRIQ